MDYGGKRSEEEMVFLVWVTLERGDIERVKKYEKDGWSFYFLFIVIFRCTRVVWEEEK